ncbi:MAG TPA: 50S ribosomal protein L6 [Candidatus Ratteibacteria bacterium]|jgi:large subunit ribosomal protein L6|uniref:50S ribosomal protein L6 n=1 Tax=candidate division TA06 bacterium ADurb.Bin131 TaxID=1852827 RepID=A0A1V6C4D0_UNCT6|nr:MAG: 50S ribosomal protein L6 [candidate division TA06 bacterium ADurb.Bin131]HOC03084.1 50S ribosomal protein L6 [bacterium]HRS07123.1 50S ribosomal protein L6 [Candidatus Ratteibacteria bacterium]HON04864.1 50S ribosomal protein L6 [bacterium]HPC29452.1 50S ribosomal protein L6 [bacterium]
MGRLGKKFIEIPDKVNVSIKDRQILIDGPKGKITQNIFDNLEVVVQDRKIQIINTVQETPRFRRLFRKTDALQGLLRTLIINRIKGVTSGFEKVLEIHGVGFKAEVKGNNLIMNLGFTHPVEVDIPGPITVQIEKNTVMKFSSYDKELLGDFVARVRNIFPPEPYKGRGIRYAGEYVRHKVGKAAVGTQK